MRQQRGRAESARNGSGEPAMMLDPARTADDAVGPQRRAAVHGDGRDGGGGPHRGRGRPGHPHGGRPAGGRRAVAGDRGGAGGARQERAAATPSRSAFPRCGRASRGIMPKPMACRSSADRVIVTTGSSAGFILAFLAMFEPGDRVAIANPGYPPYRHILTALGCEPVLIETDAANALCASPARALRAAHREEAARRRAGRKPGQSDRHHDDARGARRP